MTMKLSSMTDSGVFVLIENQEGRRFSGKKHLTDAYLNGTLKPLCNDVEVQLNPEVNSLNEVPQQNVDTSLPSLEQLKVQKNHSNSENERLSTKRHHGLKFVHFHNKKFHFSKRNWDGPPCTLHFIINIMLGYPQSGL
jgi:hypothetical protein